MLSRTLSIIPRYGICLFALNLLLSSCATNPQKTPATQGFQLTPYSYSQLPGWTHDQQQYAFRALTDSCRKNIKKAPERLYNDPRGTPAWLVSCQGILATPKPDSASDARAAIERYFTPYLATYNGNPNGLFTGYYQPMINGSLSKTSYYSVPLYGKPSNLKYFYLNDGKKQYLWKVNGHYVKMPTRAQIDAHGLPANTPILAWVHDEVDRYFLQVQGSGVIRLTDGRELPLGYAGQNGYHYYPIGRYLVQIGALQQNQVSMQTIRQWLKAHPDQVQKILNLDPSFVFFRKTMTLHPLGAQSTPLIPGRSMAVDLQYFWLGTPLWLDSYYPHANGSSARGNTLQRLLVAQDTGGAIKGVVRGDVFWGSDDHAVFYAGHMQSKGRCWLLLPKGLPVAEYTQGK